MSLATPTDVFTDVINDLMNELHTLPHSTTIILDLLVNNIDSPVLPEIQNLSLYKLKSRQMATLVPVLANMTGLTSLALPRWKTSPDHLKFIFTECPALSKLQSLDLGKAKDLRSGHLLPLAHSTTLTNLTSLNLEYCVSVTDATDSPVTNGLIALFSSPVVKNLSNLNLSGVQINVPICSALATSPFLSNLVSLDLSFNHMGADQATALAASTTLVNVTDLNLSGNYCDHKWIAQLFSPPSILPTKLRSLELMSAKITVSSLEMVLKASPHLTELNLYWNDQLGPAGAELIAASAHNLTKLNLGWCNIGQNGYLALAASTALSNLRELTLEHNQTAPDSIIALVNSPVMANLTHLDLSQTHNRPKVLIAIAQSATMSKLQHLDFGHNPSGDEGLVALAQSATLAHLTSLNLGKNQIGDTGITAFAQSTTLTKLTRLDLSSNNIGPAGVNALCTSPVVSKLTYLRLGFNQQMKTTLPQALAVPSSTLYSLLELALDSGSLDDEDVFALLAASNLDQLNALDISGNSTGEAAQELHRSRFDRCNDDDF